MAFPWSARVVPVAASAAWIALWSQQRQRGRILFCEPLQQEPRFFHPVNRPQFPSVLDIQGSKFELVSSGTRRVTFLSIAVYDVGIYIHTAHEDMAKLITELKSEDDQSLDLQARLLDPVKGSELLDKILDLSLAIRITPTRNTDIAHMRDGFVRGVLARFEPDEASLQAFKEFFPNPRKSFTKDQVMLLTSWNGRDLRLEIDGHDYGSFSAHAKASRKLVKSFLATYISGLKVASEPVRQEFVQQLVAVALENGPN